MHDAARVRFRKPAGHLRSNMDGFARGKRTAAQPLGQRGPFVEGHHDKSQAVAGFFHPMNDSNIGMIQRRGGASLAQKALLVALAGVQLKRQEFESDRPLQPQIERAIDHPHAARTRDRENPVVAGDDLALREGVL